MRELLSRRESTACESEIRRGQNLTSIDSKYCGLLLSFFAGSIFLPSGLFAWAMANAVGRLQPVLRPEDVNGSPMGEAQIPQLRSEEKSRNRPERPSMYRVFISYSHDSAEHQKRVLALANQLRADGIDAGIDQYVQDPDEGWLKWMRTQVKGADKVLLVFTETYHRRFTKRRARAWAQPSRASSSLRRSTRAVGATRSSGPWSTVRRTSNLFL